MDQTAALIQILEHLHYDRKREAAYELVNLAQAIVTNRHGFHVDIEEAIETYRRNRQ